ncbi:MAG: alpha/beta hydrolase [Myxococcales bacterium]|nr:alpha/beta hydrolase [Myxococcales bacterium]
MILDSDEDETNMNDSAVLQRRPLLSHERYGHGSNVVFVLHEFYGCIRSWDPLRPFLDADRFSYIFVDLRGYGASARITGRCDAEEISGDVAALATALSIPRYSLIGHSMTGMAIQHALVIDAKEARAIERAVAVTPAPTDGYDVDDAAKAFFQSTTTDDEALAQAISMLTSSRWGEAYFRYKRRLNRSSSDPTVMARYLEHLIFPRGFAEAAAKAAVTTPLLVVAGVHDGPGVQLRDLQRSMGDAFPRVQWAELEGAGHYPMDECPVSLATVIQRFLTERG